MFDGSQYAANSPATTSAASANGWVRTPRALNATVLVAHSSPVIAAGLLTLLRGLEGCEVRALDVTDEPCDAAGCVVIVDDLALAARFSTCAGAEPIRGAIPKVALLTDRAKEVDPSSMRFIGVSAWLSIDCPKEELLRSVRELIEDALPRHWVPSFPSNNVARQAPHGAPAAPRRRPTGGLAPGPLRRVREHIEASFSRKIELSDLACIAGVSTAHFCRAFKQSIGMPPHRYVTTRRLAAAVELIRKTAKPLAEVAIEVGFSDQPHFTRVFTQIIGETPGTMRRRYQ